jgi:tripartite-type tricarboxylate transporter receptor subunit TctC
MTDQAFDREYLAAQGLEPILGTPEQFAAFIRSETVKWGKLVKDAKITVTKKLYAWRSLNVSDEPWP